MASFNQKSTAPTRSRSPIRTNGSAITFEGGKGASLDSKSELFLTAINSLMEDSFYESADERGKRITKLVQEITATDPDWVARFAKYLRNELHLRAVPIVVAAAYVAAGGPHGKDVVDSVLQRADEPGEFLAYWKATFNKPGKDNVWVPQPVKKGLRQAVARLYNERSVLKYDSSNDLFRMADVIELAHPSASAPWQADLWRYILTRRHHPDDARNKITSNLGVLSEHFRLADTPVDERRKLLSDPDTLTKAGFTWERLSSWLSDGKGMDKDAWEAMIPSMGYMALLRNLRNFDQAKISKEARQFVLAKLTDPDEVAKSKQFPFRFYSAYQAVESLEWGSALETALDLSTQNIPELEGRTLILTDTSGSMTGLGLSSRGTVTPAECAALFAVAQARKAKNVTFVSYASTWETIRISDTTPTLVGMQKIMDRQGRVGHGTNTFQALGANYKDHDRVIIFTDMQAHPSDFKRSSIKAPIYTFVLGGYATAHLETDGKTHIFGGGFSDGAFKMLKLLEEGKSGHWPF